MDNSKPLILFVDDEPALLNALQRAFRESDFGALFAQSGPEALHLLEEQPIQVVVADMQMPGMNGLELQYQIKARFPDVVRVLLSGYPNPDPEDVSALVQAVHRGDIFRFVAKNAVMLEAIDEVVELALEHRRLHGSATVSG